MEGYTLVRLERGNRGSRDVVGRLEDNKVCVIRDLKHPEVAVDLLKNSSLMTFLAVPSRHLQHRETSAVAYCQWPFWDCFGLNRGPVVVLVQAEDWQEGCEKVEEQYREYQVALKPRADA